MNNILSLWLKNRSFKIEENGKTYHIDLLETMSEEILKNLKAIDLEWKDKTVYMDVKDRKLFILLFITLLKFESRIVLLPIEINPDEFLNSSVVYLTDNKKAGEGIFINEDFSVSAGNKFSFPKKVSGNEYATFFLYTSGSTGKAKLIPKDDSNMLTELKELNKIFSVTESDSFYFTSPLYHIYGLLFGFLLPLYSGAHLIIDYHFTPETVVNFVSGRSVDFFISIPAYYNMFCDLGLIENFKK